jgi:hypothetical protein
VSAVSIAVPLTAGAVIVGAAFAGVPREDRRVHWPVLAAVVVLGAVVTAVLLRGRSLPVPPARKMVPQAGGAVLPFPALHAA